MGERCRLRRVTAADVAPLAEILRQPGVAAWWPRYDADRVRREMLEGTDEVVYVVDVEGRVAGAVQYWEETEPDYRHASIDIFVGDRDQGRGIGTNALRTLARHLVDERGHHRLTIDPAAHNERAIRAYRRVGFRPVGVLRRYERGPDGEWHDGLLMDLLADELT